MANKMRDLTGQKFHRLTALRPHSKSLKTGGWLWEFVCECGNHKITSGSAVTTGKVRGCGSHNKGWSKLQKKPRRPMGLINLVQKLAKAVQHAKKQLPPNADTSLIDEALASYKNSVLYRKNRSH